MRWRRRTTGAGRRRRGRGRSGRRGSARRRAGRWRSTWWIGSGGGRRVLLRMGARGAESGRSMEWTDWGLTASRARDSRASTSRSRNNVVDLHSVNYRTYLRRDIFCSATDVLRTPEYPHVIANYMAGSAPSVATERVAANQGSASTSSIEGRAALSTASMRRSNEMRRSTSAPSIPGFSCRKLSCSLCHFWADFVGVTMAERTVSTSDTTREDVLDPRLCVAEGPSPRTGTRPEEGHRPTKRNRP